ncbi:MAG: DNA polymerase I [Candidatus Berkelbacteria bacterium Licking1014_7]|uniref:DNA polymerase I n=1 Tax=Candidatus Berkelbacteria bacterium Licking1014_7 TaxID=2017147 RepID=A0A554LI64_9BACT|nr:MAG: DNA polymerase I [Candidatus Berkelbacteria bacterium Licking1014_7]
MPKIFIFDGNALAHRAYHAMPILNDRRGQIVNAVYGFFSILLSVLSRHNPKYIFVAFDVAGKTFRDKIFTDYKAKRKKPPQDFYDQLPIIKDILHIFEIPVVQKKGYEADDLIGALSKKLSQEGENEIFIVTADQDVFQLVSRQVKVLSFSRGINQEKIYGQSQVKEKIGVEPKNICDYKALSGDSSDNIPGVLGIGPKTARDLISQYGTLKNIYQNLGKIPDKIQARLKQSKDNAFMSLKLATINSRAPINFDLKEARLRDFNQEKIEKEFLKFGFKSLVKRLPQSQRRIAAQDKLF